jgi:dimethylargininase
VLLNSAWVDRAAFRRYQCLEVPAEERFAADCLVVENMVHVSSSWPRTRDLLERHGFGTRTIDISEFEKAEGGLTCLSLLFSDLAPRRTT